MKTNKGVDKDLNGWKPICEHNSLTVSEVFERINSFPKNGKSNDEKAQTDIPMECTKIAEKFAIDFYEWRSTTHIKNIEQFTNEEAIKMFKDEYLHQFCFFFVGALNEPHTKCRQCGREEWQHK